MALNRISVENLGKEYVIGGPEKGIETFREMIVSAAAAPFQRLKRLNGDVVPRERIWALKDVNLEVEEGEVVGIIGRNGAGKSTLLKVLSRITTPTEGRVKIRGRVSSLLEVGTGFHPELTGRENIYLNGAILGMSRKEIGQKFEEIIEFSGVEKFIDTPVKRYSSGMSVRLAFAVAAHLEPETLVVDEVLAVGDAGFQQKCLGKMKDVASSGRTVLFVSHNMGAVRQLCDRAIIMNAGKVTFDGEVDSSIQEHLSAMQGESCSQTAWTWSGDDAPGNEELRLRRVTIGGEDSPGPVFRPDESVSVTVEYEQLRSVRSMRITLRVFTPFGELAFATADEDQRNPEGYPAGIYRSECRLPAHLFNTTTYTVRLNCTILPNGFLVKDLEVARFSIEGCTVGGSVSAMRWPGVVCPRVAWTVGTVGSLEAKREHLVPAVQAEPNA
jgi:lipopolysaccharide transport system ATP-binding protein